MTYTQEVLTVVGLSDKIKGMSRGLDSREDTKIEME
jgi:hypothetical protein